MVHRRIVVRRVVRVIVARVVRTGMVLTRRIHRIIRISTPINIVCGHFLFVVKVLVVGVVARMIGAKVGMVVRVIRMLSVVPLVLLVLLLTIMHVVLHGRRIIEASVGHIVSLLHLRERRDNVADTLGSVTVLLRPDVVGRTQVFALVDARQTENRPVRSPV